MRMLEQSQTVEQMKTVEGHKRFSTGRIGLLVALVAAGLVGWGIYSRHRSLQELTTWTRDRAVATVLVSRPKSTGEPESLVLPGTVQAFDTARLYARTNGYVKKWLVDIGEPVKAGQLLATIDIPEVDQQLAAAHADLKTAQANAELAKTSAVRWQGLLTQDAVSQQETDERVGDLAAKQALMNSAAANVSRLNALVAFSRIIAPFDGVVTSRSVEIGQLLTVGDAAARPLFTVSDIARVRIFVRVPQAYSGEIRTGEKVTLRLPEYPSRQFEAVLTRSDGAVDLQSGTVLVELQAPNPTGALKPGAYAQVSFPIGGANSGASGVLIPVSAVLFRSDGTLVAVVGSQGRVSLRHITIGRDLGETLEVKTGLTSADDVIENPPDSVAEGDAVRVQTAQDQETRAKAHAKT
jgi:RND family efflux transporter MFP subunit